MPDRKLEIGIGATTISPRPYVSESSSSAGQIWISGEPTRRVAVTALTAFDDDALGVGGALRVDALRADRLALGVETEVGFAWGGVSMPVAARVFDQTWIYSGPRLGTWGLDPIFGVPVGVSARVVDGLILRAEWQRSWQSFEYYNRRDHLGAAIAYQYP